MTLIDRQEIYIEQLGEQAVEAHELPGFIRKSFGMKGKLISGMRTKKLLDM